MKQLLALLLFVPSLCLAQIPDYVSLDGLVGWYPFNGNTENLAGVDGTLATTSTDWTMDRDGIDSSAIAFTALNSYAFGSLPADFQNNHYSYALWWRIDGAYNYNGYNLLTYPSSSPGNLDDNALAYTIDENWYYLNCPDATSGYTSSARIGYDHTLRALDCAVLEDMEQWNHSVVTVDGTMMKLYFNGTFIDSVSVDLDMSDYLGETLVLGARNNPAQNSLTTRILDDVGIWNRALGEEEIFALYSEAAPSAGCSDPEACNYDTEAIIDDGSCIPSGCLDETACNFNAEAGCSGGECEYDSDLLDCGTFGFEVDSLLACMGEEIEVNAPEVPDAHPGSGSAEFIASFSLDFGGPSQHTLGPQATGQYEITVSGTWCGGSCWNGHTSDAAYSFNHPYGNGINPLGGNSFTINEYCPQDDNSCELIRPEPDEYNPDHVYTYFFDHSGGELVVYGLADECCWGDNQAGLDFSVSRLPSSPCPLDYTWSTGASSVSIITQPVASSYVSVTVSSSVETCTDSLWIDLIDSGCADSEACNYNSSDLCFADCIYPLLGASDCEGGALACGAGTTWDHTLQQCVAIELVPDTIVIEPEACAPSCGEGTVWDPVNEECIIAIPADLNYDGCVTVNDLLELLIVHGTCPPYPEWPDEPIDTIWTCGDPVDYWDYDYATVLIGDQCWFADNLKTNKFSDGTSVTLASTDNDWVNGYPNPQYSVNYAIGFDGDYGYGYFYNAPATLSSAGLCPSGWHVSTEDDWTTLESHLGMSDAEIASSGFRGTEQGFELKYNSPWSISWLDGSDNESGFSAIQAGYRNGFEQSAAAGDIYDSEARFWATTSDAICTQYYHGMRARRLISGEGGIGIPPGSCSRGYSVRCVKD